MNEIKLLGFDMPLQARPAKRRRSPRLEKKLHIGAFQQLGFELSLRLREGLSDAEDDGFWDAFIAEIAARSLSFGGGWEWGYVAGEGRRSAPKCWPGAASIPMCRRRARRRWPIPGMPLERLLV